MFKGGRRRVSERPCRDGHPPVHRLLAEALGAGPSFVEKDLKLDIEYRGKPAPLHIDLALDVFAEFHEDTAEIRGMFERIAAAQKGGDKSRPIRPLQEVIG